MLILSYPSPDRSVKLEALQKGRANSRRYRNRRIGEFIKEMVDKGLLIKLGNARNIYYELKK